MQQPPGGGYPPGGGFPPGWPQGGDQGQQGGYGQPQQPQWGQQGYPQQGGFGAPQQPSQPGRPAGIDQTLAMPEMSAQPPGGPPGYGAPGGFGAPQQGGFGAPQPGGFNPMQPAGGMIPAGMAPTAGSIPFQPGMKSQTLAMDYNQAGFFCYLPCVGILALVFAITEPKEPARKWLRFHAFQALLVGVAGNVIIRVVSTILAQIAAALSLVGLLISLGLVVYMVMLGLKAKNGETPKVPFLGDLAEKWA